MPKGLEEFIQHQTKNNCFDIYNAINNSGKFVEYINQPSTKPRGNIQILWGS